jgi:hypothetical protein
MAVEGKRWNACREGRKRTSISSSWDDVTLSGRAGVVADIQKLARDASYGGWGVGRVCRREMRYTYVQLPHPFHPQLVLVQLIVQPGLAKPVALDWVELGVLRD